MDWLDPPLITPTSLSDAQSRINSASPDTSFGTVTSTGELTDAGAGEWVQAFGDTNVFVYGDFDGTAHLEISPDTTDDTAAVPYSNLATGDNYSFTAPTHVQVSQDNLGVYFRVVADTINSGTLRWRIG